MKVKELIEELQKHDGEARILFQYDQLFKGGSTYASPEEINLTAGTMYSNFKPSGKLVYLSADVLAQQVKEEVTNRKLSLVCEKVKEILRTEE